MSPQNDSPQLNRPILNRFLPLGPLALPVFIIVTGISIFFLFRSGLTYVYRARFTDTPEFLWLFPIGLRMDLILLSYITILPAALSLLLSPQWLRKLGWVFCAWFTVIMCILIYMEIATFPFIEEFDLRPDQKFLEYLGHVHEVATTLWKVYKVEVAIGFIAIIVSCFFFWRACRYLIEHGWRYGWKTRLALLPVVLCLLVLGARSTLGHRPANLSTAAFSANHLANELALNSTYSVTYAAYRMLRFEKNPSLIYGTMERGEVLNRVSRSSTLAGELVPSEIPFLQKQTSPFTYDRPPNVVIFLQESMGAVDTGCLKGPDITPNLCRLKEEGLWFSNLYATGTRTVRGIEATVSGFLPTAARGVVKLGLAKKGFLTAATLFRSKGYATEFLYGGMSNFDEMRTFFMGNDFQTIYDEPTFENPVFRGTWGVSDEDLVRKANEVFKAHGDKPFFSLILSTSNHTPYEFPDGRIELYEQPKQTHFNAIKYADYAIGLLFELAKKEDYYKNTIFLIVADHNSHVKGNDYVPISKFHIPAFIVGPNVPQREIKTLSSQVDLLPTILHFTGGTMTHPLVGRNLMTLPDSVPGRAFMQYGEHNAYRINDEVIISRPFVPQEEFTYVDEKLVPSTLNPEMAKDALAHTHLPWILYSEKLYKLPAEQAEAAVSDQ